MDICSTKYLINETTKLLAKLLKVHICKSVSGEEDLHHTLSSFLPVFVTASVPAGFTPLNLVTMKKQERHLQRTDHYPLKIFTVHPPPPWGGLMSCGMSRLR